MTKVSITIEHDNQRKTFEVEQESRYISPVLFAAVNAAISSMGDEIGQLLKAFQVITAALHSVASETEVKEK